MEKIDRPPALTLNTKMLVEKRNGVQEKLSFDKITERIRRIAAVEPKLDVDPVEIALHIINPENLTSGMKTSKIDDLIARYCGCDCATKKDYLELAGRISLSNLYKSTPTSVFDAFQQMYQYVHPITKKHSPKISLECWNIMKKYADKFEQLMDRTMSITLRTYFGLKTLENGYLQHINDQIIERPQYALLRVAIGIHGDNYDRIVETYEYMIYGYFTHATPTLFNAGTPHPTLSSCYLTGMYKDDNGEEEYSEESTKMTSELTTSELTTSELTTSELATSELTTSELTTSELISGSLLNDAQTGDSIDGMYDTARRSARISKAAGGLGISVSNIRSDGTYIAGTGGKASGLVPLARVINNIAVHVDQGGGKRRGAFVLYLEPWHPDIIDFLKLRSNQTIASRRASDLFYGMWIPDLFLQRVREKQEWSLFDPHECPGLDSTWGDEFNALYLKYENEGRARRTISAHEVWFAIMESQMETGMPYMMSKDSANRKSNHQHMGTIKCSNLCTEIIEFTSRKHTAVCNLASIALPKFVMMGEHPDAIETPYGLRYFDHDHLRRCVHIVTRNLNMVIDREDYPTKETRTANMETRPIGIGIQGLADVFMLLRMPFESDEAMKVNREIAETIYFAALEMSMWLAMENGTYTTYPGSPVSRGILQHDMWVHGIKPDGSNIPKSTDHPFQTGRWNWDQLREDIATHGVYNSLLVAPMPTATTAHILGNNDCFEPYASNIFTRKVLSGVFTIINQHMMRDLIRLGLWNEDTKDTIILHNGSIQRIPDIPDDIKALYKTVWEIRQKHVIDMAAARGPYIDQSQSMNLFLEEATFPKLSTLYMHAWKRGLKTLQYYLRQRPAQSAQKFSIDKSRETRLLSRSNSVVSDATTTHSAFSIHTAFSTNTGFSSVTQNAARVVSPPPDESTMSQLQSPPTSFKNDSERIAAMEQTRLACSRANPEACTMCSS